MVASKSPDPYSAKHPFPNFFSFWRKAEKPNEDSPPWTRLYRRFTLKELRLAIDNFGLKIGQDGHYSVYKGFINGGFNETVTIKMYDNNSLISHGYFLSEMELPWKRDHPNGSHRYTVFEFMPHGTLHGQLHSKNDSKTLLSWKKRLEICIGAGRGIEFLHSGNPLIIHGDIKPFNILLDNNWFAKIVAPDCLKAYADIVYKCSNERGSERPSMADVVKRLELILLFQECFEADLPFSPSWLASIAPSPKKNEPLSGVDFQDSNIFVSDYDSEELLRD
ncbi:hypothetical protein ES332_D02G139800v1 [Gossypium tomentosum]|uniref:Protein kinase domain-containing protein n=1 Tax=Gossypium tomentosum TaxID=34277 RepID=A0A5D2LWZ1_GOSTO|nr:hypothetical protein ES332_D02G139800v1 [Gossypium tomentosum]